MRVTIRLANQEELAHRAEIHQTYLSGVENGRRNPSILVLDRIAQPLDSDIEQLLSREKAGDGSAS